MSLNKVIIIFLVCLAIFAGVIFFQFSKGSVPTSKLTIGEHTFLVSVAKTSEEQQKGLSERSSLPQDQGMLFVFNEPADQTFWMKGMKIPIDIIFINNDKIVAITKNAPPVKAETDNLPLYSAQQPVDKVLEINAGLSDKYKFKIGDKVSVNITQDKSASSAADK